MKQHSIFMKVIAVILTVIMIVGILPMTVFAQEFNETQLMKTVEIESDKKEKSPIVGEVTDKRDENTKVFERRDGSYTAVITSEPIHYDDNGEWKEIDNTLVKTNNKITNKENSFSVDFPSLIRFSWLYRFHGKAKLHSMQDGFTEIIRAKRMFEFMIM